MQQTEIHIGEAARRSGVRVQTLHYYERRGLLRPSRGVSTKYRVYSEDAIRRVLFIRRAQALGFTLDEIKELLEIRIDSGATCGDVRSRAEAKLNDVKEKIQTLRSMQNTLERVTAACSGQGAVSECPILESLDSESGRR